MLAVETGVCLGTTGEKGNAQCRSRIPSLACTTDSAIPEEGRSSAQSPDVDGAHLAHTTCCFRRGPTRSPGDRGGLVRRSDPMGAWDPCERSEPERLRENVGTPIWLDGVATLFRQSWNCRPATLTELIGSCHSCHSCHHDHWIKSENYAPDRGCVSYPDGLWVNYASTACEFDSCKPHADVQLQMFEA